MHAICHGGRQTSGGGRLMGTESDTPTLRPVTVSVVNDTMQALRSLCTVDTRDVESTPAFLRPHPMAWKAADVLAFPNGLVHLPSLLAHEPHFEPPTPTFFNISALGFPYDPNARPPALWLRFLKEV